VRNGNSGVQIAEPPSTGPALPRTSSVCNHNAVHGSSGGSLSAILPGVVTRAGRPAESKQDCPLGWHSIAKANYLQDTPIPRCVRQISGFRFSARLEESWLATVVSVRIVGCMSVGTKDERTRNWFFSEAGNSAIESNELDHAADLPLSLQWSRPRSHSAFVVPSDRNVERRLPKSQNGREQPTVSS
jgi:hypothetical protein